eukprot:11188497-Lingulodinium_polyedra.AAC.1
MAVASASVALLALETLSFAAALRAGAVVPPLALAFGIVSLPLPVAVRPLGLRSSASVAAACLPLARP